MPLGLPRLAIPCRLFGRSFLLLDKGPQRVRWQSIAGVTFAVATSIGPYLGAFLVASYGWRAAMLVVPVLCVVAQVIIFVGPRLRPVHQQLQKFDFPGAFLLCAFIASSLIALKGPFIGTGAGMQVAVSSVICLVSLYLFVRRQSSFSHPVMSFEILRKS